MITFILASKVPITVFGSEVMMIQKSNKYSEVAHPHKYNFNSNIKIRFWQLVFYLYHTTECHSIFLTSAFEKNFIRDSKSQFFDHLLLFIAMQKTNLYYVDSACYFRTYREVLGLEFSHLNGAGITENRWQRVNGRSTEKLSFSNVPLEIFSAWKPFLNIWEKPIALLLLRLKYSQSWLLFLVFRMFRYLFGKLTPWKT